MSIDKWLSDDSSKEEKIKREEAFKQLSKVEVQDLKKKKIRDIIEKEKQKLAKTSENDKFLQSILEFKEWLNTRTYIKGDIEKFETRISNLYLIIQSNKGKMGDDEKKLLIEEYKSIPPKFIDENTRIALNKKIRNMKRTNSDNYYLRKLKKIIQENLTEAKYYKCLEKILELF
ncbi:MAG: hypothetical protein ACXAAI_12610 [Promethearchaeota archaeon]|jgi:hypothetical protein